MKSQHNLLQGLLQVASVFTAMSRLYLTRVMNENFRENFLSRREKNSVTS